MPGSLNDYAIKKMGWKYYRLKHYKFYSNILIHVQNLQCNLVNANKC